HRAGCRYASCRCRRTRARPAPACRHAPRAHASRPRRSVSGRCCRGTRTAVARLLLAELEHGEERLLRHLDATHLLHPLLALLLLLEQLFLAGDVAAVALG